MNNKINNFINELDNNSYITETLCSFTVFSGYFPKKYEMRTLETNLKLVDNLYKKTFNRKINDGCMLYRGQNVFRITLSGIGTFGNKPYDIKKVVSKVEELYNRFEDNIKGYINEINEESKLDDDTFVNMVKKSYAEVSSYFITMFIYVFSKLFYESNPEYNYENVVELIGLERNDIIKNGFSLNALQLYELALKILYASFSATSFDEEVTPVCNA